MTNKERMLAAARGEMPDRMPYAPRIDLWYTANARAGTLPPDHASQSMDQICRSYGWGLHKVVPEYMAGTRPDASYDRALGVHRLKECPYLATLPDDVERVVEKRGRKTRVEYRTPLGDLRTVTVYTEEMEAAGASITWVEERVLKAPQDYKALGYIFRNMKVEPTCETYEAWRAGVGEDGIATGYASPAASPLHHIMKEFLGTTSCYYHFHDNRREMLRLMEDMTPYYERILEVLAQSPAEVVLWGANFDDTITPPPLFEEFFVPWLGKASDTLRKAGKLTLSHCDGENLGLLDLIRDSGIDAAEAVCPHPMTRVTVGEYYSRWRDRLTIFGGIPSNLLLEDVATDAEFETYMRDLFEAIAPGDRFILGVADTTPPDAKFGRLVRAGELAEELGPLPLQAGGDRGATERQIESAALKQVEAALAAGGDADGILHGEILPAMEVVGERFRDGDAFIPEVLLSARAVNAAVEVLGPRLRSRGEGEAVSVLLGTVRGDLHDIGKNLVAVTLRGSGFQVVDLGINIPTETFLEKVQELKPTVLGLSALLTTTMPTMAEVIRELEAHGLRDSVKVMVGGAPINDSFARKIGADGYGANAGDAVALIRELVGGMK
jgi:methylmalonyl-CoA mutase cobalamin-binding domain/chain